MRPRTAVALFLAVVACSPDEGSTTASTTSVLASAPESEREATLDVVVPSGVVTIAAIDNGTPPPLPSGAIEHRVDVDGHDLFAIELAGDEPPVVLAHGFPDNLHLYDRLYPLLSGRRVIAFDFVGWGRSDKPAPGVEYDYTTASQVAQLRRVIDHFELTDARLVVHDQSAPVGLELLRTDPSGVASMVLLNGFYAPSPALTPPKGIELHADERLQAAEVAVQSDPAAVEAYFRFQMDEFIVAATDEEDMVDRLWSLFPEAQPAFVALNDVLIEEVVERLETVDELADIAVPVDIVYGAQDPYLTTGTAEEFDALLPTSTLTVVADAGHFVQIDRPDVVAESILRR